jgi:imidazolonepropionase-like amidohydrolase
MTRHRLRQGLIAAVVLLGAGVAPADGRTVAIRAGHLIDPATGEVETGRTIFVEDGKILSIGSDVIDAEVDETIDLSDSWVIPGLMDAHVHLTLAIPASQPGGSEWGSFYNSHSSGRRALLGMRIAREVLQAGFTTVKEIGNSANYVDTDLRVAIERGWFDGPTVVNAGKIIAPFGGQSSGVPAELGPTWHFEYLDADSPEEVRKAVRRNIYYGARTIKLVADPNSFYYSVEEMRAAVEEAALSGMTVAVHAVRDESVKNAVLAGVAAIEHGIFLSDETLELMKEHGTYLVGTDFPLEHLRGHGGAIGRNPEFFADAFVDRLRRAHELDVPMAFGTDTVIDLPGKDRGEMMLDYLAVWTEAGIPAAKILRCMTIEVARLMGLEEERGAIAAGRMADIVAMPASPLADIENLRGIDFVMKDGKVIRAPESVAGAVGAPRPRAYSNNPGLEPDSVPPPSGADSPATSDATAAEEPDSASATE